MNDFIFDTNKDVILYGSASIGKLIFGNLIKQNYKVIGFVDKRAKEITSFLGVKVYSPDEISLLDREAVVIISVKNVFEHYRIAQQFIDAGFYNLIYMPKMVLEGIGNQGEIKKGEVYTTLVDNDTGFLNASIEKTFSQRNAHISEYPIVRDEGDEVIANIPVDFIFTNDYKGAMSKWGNVNSLAFFTHLNFFGYLMGYENCYVDDYVNEYCAFSAINQGDIAITEAWKDNVVRNRAMIYKHMNLNYELDREFFVRNPATAQWNKDRSYFNLTSGKHRTSFLIAKGNDFIPLKISRDDYEIFLNRPIVDKYKYLLERTEIPYPIRNPFCYSLLCDDCGFIHLLIRIIVKYSAETMYRIFGRIEYNLCKVVIESDQFIFCANYFSRMGANVEINNCCFSEICHAIAEIEQVDYQSKKVENSYFTIYMGKQFDRNIEICDIYVLESYFETDELSYVKTISGYWNEKAVNAYIYRRINR